MDIAIFELASEESKEPPSVPPSAKPSTLDKIKSTVIPNTGPDATAEEKVSANARVVVLGLFALVGFVVAVFAYVSVGTSDALSDSMIAVFTAAITGILTLGGTMVQQLWGK
jgi:hypothetical protein